jgi:outer membrane protein assembly factor BamB
VRRPRIAFLLVALGAACAFTVVAAAGDAALGHPVSWATYGGGLTSANVVPAGGLTVASARTLHVSWARKLDGTVFGGPVIGSSRLGRRVVVGTEAGTLYALNSKSGGVAWSRRITRPVAACGGEYGITSMPGIDEKAGLVYAIGASGYLTAVDFATGVVRWRLRVVIRTDVEYVWSAVRLVGGYAYVAVASYCDQGDKDGPPDGYLLCVDLAKRKVVARFDVVPGPHNLGGIWGWGGVSVAAGTGALFTSTGNSIVKKDGDLIEDAGHAERVLQLTPALKVVDSTPPPLIAPEDRGDEDFGATPLLFDPAGCPALVAANSKNGHTYVWRRGKLSSGPVWDAPIGSTNPDDPFLGQPTYLPSLRLLVVAETNFGDPASPSRGLSAFSVNAGCTRFTPRWNLNIGGGPQPPPIAVGQVVIASAPATHQLMLVDARNGTILAEFDTDEPVYAPPASDGTAVYTASIGGIVEVTTPAAQ